MTFLIRVWLFFVSTRLLNVVLKQLCIDCNYLEHIVSCNSNENGIFNSVWKYITIFHLCKHGATYKAIILINTMRRCLTIWKLTLILFSVLNYVVEYSKFRKWSNVFNIGVYLRIGICLYQDSQISPIYIDNYDRTL